MKNCIKSVALMIAAMVVLGSSAPWAVQSLRAQAVPATADDRSSTVDDRSSTAPRTISYQGVLANTDGTAITDGEYSITMRIYSDVYGVKEVWRDTYKVPVAHGVFNLALGSGATALPEASAMDQPLWLSMQVGDQPELKPFSAMTASAYALNVADKSISANKISADYVKSITLNGQTVSGNGKDVNIQTGDGVVASLDPATNTILLKGGNASLQGAKGGEVQGNTTISGSLTVTGSTFLGSSSAGTYVYGVLTASKDILPVSDNTQSLGSLSHRWMDLYLGGGTLKMIDGSTMTQLKNTGGTVTLSVTSGGVTTDPLTMTTDGVTTTGTQTTTGPITSGNSIVIDGTATPRFINSDAGLDVYCLTAGTGVAGGAISILAGTGGPGGGMAGGNLTLTSGAQGSGGGSTDGDIILKTGGASGTTWMTFNHATGPDMNSHQIHSVTDPSSAQDAATKNYVDNTDAVAVAVSVILAPNGSTRNVIQPTGAAVVPLKIKGYSGQSAHLQDWENSSTTVLAAIDQNGAATTAGLDAGSGTITTTGTTHGANLTLSPLTSSVGITIGSGSTGNDITGNSWHVAHSGAITSTGLDAGSGLIMTSGWIITTGTGGITSAGLLTTNNGLTVTSGTVTLPAASIADAALSSNVALLNGGQTFSAGLTINSGLTLGTQLSVANGGTGATTLTGVLHGNGTSAISASNVNLTSDVTGTLPVAYGGTGATTLTLNTVLFGNGTSAVQAVPVNASATNMFLTQSSSGAPAWSALVAGDIPTGSGNYIQNQSAGAQGPASYWITGSGQVGTTLTAGGNINTTGGALQTAGTTRIDNSGNASLGLVNSFGLQTNSIMRIGANGEGTFTTLTANVHTDATGVYTFDASGAHDFLVIETKDVALDADVLILPTATTGRIVAIKFTGTAATLAVTNPYGAKIEGSAPPFTISPTDQHLITLMCDGTDWWIVGSGQVGTTLTVAGNINTTGGALQTAGATRIDNSGNASLGTITAGNVLTQKSSNLTIVNAHGLYTLDGTSNLYELVGAPGTNEGVALPTGSAGQIIHILNSSGSTQTINGVARANGVGVAYGQFSTAGWKLLFLF